LALFVTESEKEERRGRRKWMKERRKKRKKTEKLSPSIPIAIFEEPGQVNPIRSSFLVTGFPPGCSYFLFLFHGIFSVPSLCNPFNFVFFSFLARFFFFFF